ncbi:MAG: hypothetical protein ACHQUB_01980 [Candidatus Saccharimonadia bacterium]
MNRRTMALVRAGTIITATIGLVTGVTFAALTSPAVTLSDNSVNTALAGLNIWNGSAYALTATGFNITGLIPGTGVNENVYFQNSGGVPEALTANIPTLPTSSGFSGWNNATVSITAENTSCTDPAGFLENTATAGNSNSSPYTVNTNLADLASGQVILPCTMQSGDTGNSGVTGTSGNYDVHFDIAESAVTGPSASIGSFSLNFIGTQTP